jgi:HAD superfamily hydrolase (TIGR01490 family)
MTLAIFDLDNTLIAGDSDHAWGEFLCDQGYVDASAYREQNDRFYQDYLRGELDIMAYQRFALSPLKGKTDADLAAWHRQFMNDIISGFWLPAAEGLVASHREQGHTLMIITATNRFVTSPIAEKLGVDHLIATEPEIRDGSYTGEPEGVPCYQHGKVTRLQEWLQLNNETLDGSYFYSDSHNDLPLLEQVDNPVAVDPDDQLRSLAEQRDWPVISLRE